MIYLNSYRPLVLYRTREYIDSLGLPPFVDSSCRREPDLEAKFPAISALCRGNNFAPHLRKGNMVVYMTVKFRYHKEPALPRNYVTAVLKVIKTFKSHTEAAQWYTKCGQPLPSNCLVDGNSPLPLDKTAGFYIDPADKVRKVPVRMSDWDQHYVKRARDYPQMVATEPLYVNLYEPVALPEEDTIRRIFKDYGRMPITQTPPKITVDDCRRLMKFCNTGVRIREKGHELPPKRTGAILPDKAL